MLDRRVLIVGTTADYVEIIDRRFPHRVVFITDSRERMRASEPAPGAESELLCDLTRPTQVLAALRHHLDRWRLEPSTNENSQTMRARPGSFRICGDCGLKKQADKFNLSKQKPFKNPWSC